MRVHDIIKRPAIAAGVLMSLLAGAANAVPIGVDFEAFADLETLSAQVAGLTFSNAIVLQSGAAGGSLNEFDFPPHSGNNVLFDTGAPITIDFTDSMGMFSAYFTYGAPVTLSAYDGLVLLGSVSSALSENFVSAGGPANEFIELVGLGAFNRIVISGDVSTYVLDDLLATPQADLVSVPEPSTLSLLLLTALLLPWFARRRPQHG